VVGSFIHLVVPREVYRPGSWNPVSHLIVILDWWSWTSWLSNPVEDLIIVLRVIDTLWPWSSPGVSIHMDWDALRLGLKSHHVEDFFLVGSGSSNNGSSDKRKFHFNFKIIIVST
jgi:hypothetical protein